MSNIVPLTPQPSMSNTAARALTDALKRDAEDLWRRLLDAYERGVHEALGYSSWKDYCRTEFGMQQARSYQLLAAGRVNRALGPHYTTVGRLPSERVARELAPVLHKQGEQAVAEVWAEAVDRHGPAPTAEEVREVVKKQPRKLTREQEMFGNNLSGMALAAEYVRAKLGGRTKAQQIATRKLLDGVDETTLETWRQQIALVDAAAYQLRQYLVQEHPTFLKETE